MMYTSLTDYVIRKYKKELLDFLGKKKILLKIIYFII